MRRAILTALVLTAAVATSAGADPCAVPGDHATLAAAIADAACSRIDLATGVHAGDVVVERDLEIVAMSPGQSEVQGFVTVLGQGVAVTVDGLVLDPAALDVAAGASLEGRNLVVRAASTSGGLLFADGFESGDASAWGP